MRARFRREDGMAMVVAMLVSSVVLTLGVVVIGLSVHNSDQSANERRRVTAIAAAEAGLDYYFSYLAATATPVCTVTQSLGTTPASSFAVTATFYNSSGATITCPASGGSNPTAVLINSVGTVGTTYPRRTMQAYAKLTPISPNTFDNSGAIFGQNNITFSANAAVGGGQYNDADIYTNGNLSLASNSIIYGNAYVQGTATLWSNAEVKKDLWANGSITAGGNARIRGSARSSTSSITLNASSHVYGSATAGTTNTGGIVDGTRTANSPGTAPPTRAYPTYTYNASDWTGAGYAVHNYSDCSTPLSAGNLSTWWGAATGTSHVIRITGGCSITFGSVSVKGNLAVITDGSIILNGKFTPATGTGPWALYFFGGLSGAPGCQFTVNNNSSVSAGLSTLIYTHQACAVTFNNNSGIAEGQIIGGTVTFKHTISFTYKRLSVPGTGGGGFKQDVAYKREIVST